MSKLFNYLLIVLACGCLQTLGYADEVSGKDWTKKHHGIIFYQDYSSDKYDLVKLADMAKELGTDIVKTWIKGDKPQEIPEKAESRDYRHMFNSFSVVCLNVCPDYILSRWDELKAYNLQTKKDIFSDFYQLTKFLIKNYDGQGKTFIINYFFEVNVYVGSVPSGRPDFPVIEFVSDAQKGVKKALAESVIKDIRIFDCIESNCDHDFFHFVKTIFPKIKVDFYSLSFYGLGSLKSSLSYWAKYAPDNSLFKDKNIILGEYGIKMQDMRVNYDEEAQNKYLESVRKEVKNWGVPYIFLFWLADQESKVKSEGDSGLVDLKGHKRKAWEYLHNAYNNKNDSLK